MKKILILAAAAATVPAAMALPVATDRAATDVYISTDTLSERTPSPAPAAVVPAAVVQEYVVDPFNGTMPTGFIPDELLEYSMLPQPDGAVEIDVVLPDDVSDDEAEAALRQLQDELTEYARKYLGTRYVWGAKGPNAFDCSGFTGYVFRNFGYDIGANSRIQATRGKKVDIKDARVGDLMFFSRPKGGKTVGHVGMVIDVNPDGSLKFIHASSRKGVTIQQFPDNGHYNRRFLQVRRVIDENQLA